MTGNELHPAGCKCSVCMAESEKLTTSSDDPRYARTSDILLDPAESSVPEQKQPRRRENPAVRIDPATEKPDEAFEPTGKSAVPWLTSSGKQPQSTPWVVQPKVGGDISRAPTPIQEIPLVRCPTCRSDRVHKYGRSKLPDGGKGAVWYYQCQNCTDPRTGYSLTRFKVRHV